MTSDSPEADAWIGEDGEDVVRLRRWQGTWPQDDPHANFKSDVVGYGLLDPLHTVRGMSRNLDIPVGAIARYVLARWATGGSGGLLEIGPVMIHRLWEPVARAESAGTDEARLAAYDQLRQMLSWLKLPLENPEIYPPQAEEKGAQAAAGD
ncbi:DUF6027 family protein [Streptomyces sp. NEAU-W12]|uniref:DUF6027 family protein n=1 Tax=Streptomyces sp. NEAU-W12 TaxID=2994668 RepID=UPI00224B1A27|nr:DUF6027 family protein [Streptomyces sp. NEAU-W12]MCX2924112.1 DUF6027 family protein [Streptomyces sp. NEAU-W12]